MGGSQSVTCRHPVNQDLRSVFTLSDSAVQRLPLDTTDSLTEREQRNQNIDDFWRERLQCLDETFLEAKYITEQEFQRLEYSIKNKAGTLSGKPFCIRGLEDTKTCYLSFPGQPMNCAPVVEKLQLCLNTMMQEAVKKKMEELRKAEKKAVC